MREKITKLSKLLTAKHPINGNEIIDVYNEWKGPDKRTGRLVPYTGCGSCLRKYLKEMTNALEEWKKEQKRKREKRKREKKKEEETVIEN